MWFQVRHPRLTAENRAWLNMAPVGREFGSADYDRLMQEDARAGIDWSFPNAERIAEIRLRRKEKKQQKT